MRAFCTETRTHPSPPPCFGTSPRVVPWWLYPSLHTPLQNFSSKQTNGTSLCAYLERQRCLWGRAGSSPRWESAGGAAMLRPGSAASGTAGTEATPSHPQREAVPWSAGHRNHHHPPSKHGLPWVVPSVLWGRLCLHKMCSMLRGGLRQQGGNSALVHAQRSLPGKAKRRSAQTVGFAMQTWQRGTLSWFAQRYEAMARGSQCCVSGSSPCRGGCTSTKDKKTGDTGTKSTCSVNHSLGWCLRHRFSIVVLSRSETFPRDSCTVCPDRGRAGVRRCWGWTPKPAPLPLRAQGWFSCCPNENKIRLFSAVLTAMLKSSHFPTKERPSEKPKQTLTQATLEVGLSYKHRKLNTKPCYNSIEDLT